MILVDEPLAALDPGLQLDLLDSIDSFVAKRRHAVVAILHDINHAMLGFDRLLLVKDGQLMHDLAADAGRLAGAGGPVRHPAGQRDRRTRQPGGHRRAAETM